MPHKKKALIEPEYYYKITRSDPDEFDTETIELFIQSGSDFLYNCFFERDYDLDDLIKSNVVSEASVKIVLISLVKKQLSAFYSEGMFGGDFESMSQSVEGYSMSVTTGKSGLTLTDSQKKMLGLDTMIIKKISY